MHNNSPKFQREPQLRSTLFHSFIVTLYVKTLILRTVDGSKNETNVAVSNSTLEKTNLTSLPNDDPNPDKNDLIKISTEEIPTTLEIANQTSVANDDQNQDEITTDSNY